MVASKSKPEVIENATDDLHQVIVQSATVVRENAVHEAFAASRVEEFVYAHTAEYMEFLDHVCSSEAFVSPKPPVAIIGPPASGKSSLLANWVVRRKLLSPNDKTMIFQHYAGASFESVKLSFFLYRLIYHLKVAFELKDFELPREHDEEKLKFSLARCLEAAIKSRGPSGSKSTKKSMIIIIDGIDNLRTEDGSERLTWLPKQFPAGVQLIVSASQTNPNTNIIPSCTEISRQTFAYDSDDELAIEDLSEAEASDTSAIRELSRRKSVFLKVQPLDLPLCTCVIQMFNETLVPEQQLPSAVIENVIQSSGSSSPLYLRIVLEALTSPHFNQAKLLQAFSTSVHSIPAAYSLLLQEWTLLLVRALDTEENGGNKSPKKDGKKTSKDQRKVLVRHALCLFAVVRHGLSERDFYSLLSETTACPLPTLQSLFTLLKPHLMKMKRPDIENEILYDFSHNALRLIVRYAYLNDENLLQSYYKTTADYLSKLPASQRRMDELPVQLELGSNWPALLSNLVDIKMFYLWWTEKNREDFIAYWIVIRNHSGGSDPVDEYIRSLNEYTDMMESRGHGAQLAEELPALLIKLSSFFRRWQLHDDNSKKPTLHRPPAPTLRQLKNCHGTFSSFDSTDPEIAAVLNALGPLQIDGYYCSRWVWAQFPLFAVAFESHYLASVFRKNNLTAQSSSSSSSSSQRNTTVIPDIKGSDKQQQQPESSSRSSSEKKRVKLPSFKKQPQDAAALALASTKSVVPRKPVMKKYAIESSTVTSNAKTSFDFLASEQDEAKVTVANLNKKIRNLRTQFDKLSFLSKEKEKEIAALDSKLGDALADATGRENAGQMEEETVSRTNKAIRIKLMCKQRTRYYQLILRQCEVHPAKDPNIIEADERRVKAMRRETAELLQKAQVISYDRKLASIEIPKLLQAIEDTEEIHRQALTRLRWRQVQCVRQNDWEMKFRNKSRELVKGNGDMGADGEAEMVQNMKNRILAQKKVNKQKRDVHSQLNTFEGGATDDGLLGKLRSAGIHSPHDLISRWDDMENHAIQLQQEVEDNETKISASREEISAMQQELMRIKLGNTELDDDDDGNEEGGLSPKKKKTKVTNVKQLEQSIASESRLNSQKQGRLDRCSDLSENLRLGLSHIIHLLGMKEQRCSNVKLISRLERGIRKLVGDEGSSGAAGASNLMLRKSASVRGQSAFSVLNQSLEDKVRFNIRVSGKSSEDDDSGVLLQQEEEQRLDNNTNVVEQLEHTRKLIKDRSRVELEKRKIQARKLEAKQLREAEPVEK